MSRQRLLEWLVLAALVLIWGSAFAAMKLATDGMAPGWVAAWRLWIGAAVLGGACLVTRRPIPPFRDPAWRWFGVVGVLGMSFPYLLYAYAATGLPSAVAAICNGSMPVFTALMAHRFVASEPLTPRRAAGVALGFGGLALLVAPGLSEGLGSVSTLATLAAIIGAVAYSAASVITRRAPPIDALTAAFIFCLWGAVTGSAAAFALSGPPDAATAAGWAAIAFLGVLPTAAASALYTWLIQARGSVFTSLGTYLSPVFALGLGVALLGERPALTAYLALALILGGVIVASRPPRVRA